MPKLHTIRLRGPWECEPLTRFTPASDGSLVESRESLPPAGIQHMPASTPPLGPDFHGRVCYRRRFGTPAHLDPHESVWLVIESLDSTAQIVLNDKPLGPANPHEVTRLEITTSLQPRNELRIEVVHTPQMDPNVPAGPQSFCDVRLEIQSEPN